MIPYSRGGRYIGGGCPGDRDERDKSRPYGCVIFMLAVSRSLPHCRRALSIAPLRLYSFLRLRSVRRFHSSTSASIISGVRFSTNSSLTWRTGAVPHEARHSTVFRVYLPSGVVSPRVNAQALLKLMHQRIAAAQIARDTGADLDLLAALRLLVIHRIKGGDASTSSTVRPMASATACNALRRDIALFLLGDVERGHAWRNAPRGSAPPVRAYVVLRVLKSSDPPRPARYRCCRWPPPRRTR